MLGLIALSFAIVVLTIVAFPLVFALGLVFLALKLVLLIVFLPVRVAFWGIGGAFHLAGFFIKMVVGGILLGVLGMIVLGLVLVPLIPIAVLALLGWLIYRAFRRPKPATTVSPL